MIFPSHWPSTFGPNILKNINPTFAALTSCGRKTKHYEWSESVWLFGNKKMFLALCFRPSSWGPYWFKTAVTGVIHVVKRSSVHLVQQRLFSGPTLPTTWPEHIRALIIIFWQHRRSLRCFMWNWLCEWGLAEHKGGNEKKWRKNKKPTVSEGSCFYSISKMTVQPLSVVLQMVASLFFPLPTFFSRCIISEV